MKYLKYKIIGTCILLIFLCFTGCIEEDCTIISARDFGEDVSYTWETSGWKTFYNYSYNSFSDGDCILIYDNISIIYYHPEENYTDVAFSWYTDYPNEKRIDYYQFKGNLTDTFKEGDYVAIKVHIKHVIITISDFEVYNLEIFEEEWVSEQYFIDNVNDILIYEGLAPMDESGIWKLNASSVWSLWQRNNKLYSHPSMKSFISSLSCKITAHIVCKSNP